MDFNKDKAIQVLGKYTWFIITNFFKYVNGVGLGAEGITINVSPEYMELKLQGKLLPPDYFFVMFDKWWSQRNAYYLKPLDFKYSEYERTGNADYASGLIEFPSFLDGIPVVLKVTGRYVPLILMETFEGLNYPQPWHKPARPFPGGFSIAHYKCTAGTFTCIVWDKKTGKKLLLSNKHVFSPLVDGILPTTRCIGTPKVGDPITQPGPYDIEQQHLGPKEQYIVGHFLREGPYDPWHTGKKNLVDSAVAEPMPDNVALKEIYQIGECKGVVEPQVGMQVQLMGRTSGYRTATIEQTPFWVPLCTCSDPYLGGLNPNCCIPSGLLNCSVPGPDIRIMTDLFDTSADTAYPGDSGSVAVTMDKKYVGQLFGGDIIYHKGICGKASNIEKVLDVSFNELLGPVIKPFGSKEVAIIAGTLLASLGLGYILSKTVGGE